MRLALATVPPEQFQEGNADAASAASGRRSGNRRLLRPIDQGGGAHADIYDEFPVGESSTTSQVIARVGMRHKFSLLLPPAGARCAPAG
ncbi:hypothetical protein G3O06_31495 [Burkholderia sp. Ac-20345]|uniref:hypothetical protein n=1 Tax=Burkholderia sp. Ac-20345 TaxID=2703891 RepID=UPI00197B89E4|nr:hypothetical protein [Burkholderia sp. Ac-20345]MBN3782028.1 hypothetical protein [Burkholderia sp. Ac-20345]